MNTLSDKHSFLENFSEIANYGGLVLPRTVSKKTNKAELPFTPHAARPLSIENKKLTLDFEQLLLKGIEKNVDGECLFLLSGGMDSSILLKLMQANNMAPKATYSTSYPFLDKRGDIEQDYALSAAEILKAADHKHIPCTVEDYFMSLIDCSVAYSDGVYFMQSPLMLNMFKEATKDLSSRISKDTNQIDFNVVNGMAADCLLGTGYHQRIFKAKNLNWPLNFIARTGFFNKVPGRINHALGKIFPVQAITDYCDLGMPHTSIDNMIWKFNHHRDYRLSFSKYDGKRIQSFADNVTESIDPLDLLTIVDMKFEMLRSSEEWNAYIKFVGSARSKVYFPFMDESIYNFLQSVPWEYRLKEHKKVLLDLGRKLGLTDEFMLRPKTGMSVNPSFAKEEFNAFFKCIDQVEKPPRVDDCRNNIKSKLNLYRVWLSILINEQAIDVGQFKADVRRSLR